MGASSDTENQPTIPQSVRHKRILDVAAERPDASLEEIADATPSATVELVEQVLEKHGDPAAETAPDTQDNAGGEQRIDEKEETTEISTQAPEWSDLTDKQREVLFAVYQNPEATQRELGDILGVSHATVCTRVNAIDGFEWAERHDFVADVIDFTRSSSPEDIDLMSTNKSNQMMAIDTLAERIVTIEQQLEAANAETRSESEITDPELVHKILQACFQDETISEDEELRIVRALMG